MNSWKRASPEAKNNYLSYRRKAYTEDRERAVKELGGVCQQCGSESYLEFDHIDPSTKTLELCRVWGQRSWKRIREELDKCQLLCKSCHKEKTRNEAQENHADPY